jgi:hypothetical protein
MCHKVMAVRTLLLADGRGNWIKETRIFKNVEECFEVSKVQLFLNCCENCKTYIRCALGERISIFFSTTFAQNISQSDKHLTSSNADMHTKACRFSRDTPYFCSILTKNSNVSTNFSTNFNNYPFSRTRIVTYGQAVMKKLKRNQGPFNGNLSVFAWST